MKILFIPNFICFTYFLSILILYILMLFLERIFTKEVILQRQRKLHNQSWRIILQVENIRRRRKILFMQKMFQKR